MRIPDHVLKYKGTDGYEVKQMNEGDDVLVSSFVKNNTLNEVPDFLGTTKHVFQYGMADASSFPQRPAYGTDIDIEEEEAAFKKLINR